MPRVILPGAVGATPEHDAAINSDIGDAISLEELIDALDAGPFDPRDEDSLAAFGPMLARLARNRDFLADMVLAALRPATGRVQGDNSYGAQVFLLRPPNGRYLLRANFWPARDDLVTRASGPAAFFYDMPHDHNFSFLTVGYLGPGYWSDYYLFDRGSVTGVPGEVAGLRFAERSRLNPGRVLLYRAHHDVHVQLPPDAFSVSLNILAYDRAQPWREQYRFDIRRNLIAEGLTSTSAEALVTIAAQFGGDEGRALAAQIAAHHPAPRMRVTALAALAATMADREARAEHWRRAAANSADAYVAGHARHRLSLMTQAIEKSSP